MSFGQTGFRFDKSYLPLLVQQLASQIEKHALASYCFAQGSKLQHLHNSLLENPEYHVHFYKRSASPFLLDFLFQDYLLCAKSYSPQLTQALLNRFITACDLFYVLLVPKANTSAFERDFNGHNDAQLERLHTLRGSIVFNQGRKRPELHIRNGSKAFFASLLPLELFSYKYY